jgi:hypothetical protein
MPVVRFWQLRANESAGAMGGAVWRDRALNFGSWRFVTSIDPGGVGDAAAGGADGEHTAGFHLRIAAPPAACRRSVQGRHPATNAKGSTGFASDFKARF